eukprot:1182524-Amorphochlora_amoeboformis.AAC.1
MVPDGYRQGCLEGSGRRRQFDNLGKSREFGRISENLENFELSLISVLLKSSALLESFSFFWK